MPDRKARGPVCLDQRESRAGRLGVRTRKPPDQRAGKCGFSSPQVAVQRDDITRAGMRGQRGAKGGGVSLSGELQVKGSVQHFEALYHACFR